MITVPLCRYWMIPSQGLTIFKTVTRRRVTAALRDQIIDRDQDRHLDQAGCRKVSSPRLLMRASCPEIDDGVPDDAVVAPRSSPEFGGCRHIRAYVVWAATADNRHGQRTPPLRQGGCDVAGCDAKPMRDDENVERAVGRDGNVRRWEDAVRDNIGSALTPTS